MNHPKVRGLMLIFSVQRVNSCRLAGRMLTSAGTELAMASTPEQRCLDAQLVGSFAGDKK